MDGKAISVILFAITAYGLLNVYLVTRWGQHLSKKIEEIRKGRE